LIKSHNNKTAKTALIKEQTCSGQMRNHLTRALEEKLSGI